MQRDPDFGQSFAQAAVRFDPVFSRLFSPGGPLPGKPPARDFFRVRGVVDVEDHQNVVVVTLRGSSQ